MLAEATLDNAALKDLLGKKVVTPAARREATTYLRRTFEMSERRYSLAFITRARSC